MVTQTLSVIYQNREIAVISYDQDKLVAYFEYTPAVLNENIETTEDTEVTEILMIKH